MNCPQCQVPVLPGSLFCGGCGTALLGSDGADSLSLGDQSTRLENDELFSVGDWPTIRTAGIVAAGLVAGLIAAGRAEIIHQMDDQMGAAALPGKTIMFRVQLMAVETEAEFLPTDHPDRDPTAAFVGQVAG